MNAKKQVLLEQKLKNLIRIEIKKQLNEDSVAFKKYSVKLDDGDRGLIPVKLDDGDYTWIEGDEFNDFLKTVKTNFKNKEDALTSFLKTKQQSYAKSHSIKQFVLSKKPKTKSEILDYISKYLQKMSQKVAPDFETYNMIMSNLIDDIAVDLKINTLEKMKISDFEMEYKREPEVGYIWEVEAAAPGAGHFKMRIKKIDGDYIFYSVDSSNIRELSISDVI